MASPMALAEQYWSAFSNGDTAVMLYDFVMTEPVKQTVRMTEWFRTSGGKLSEIRLMFDTAKFTSPADM